MSPPGAPPWPTLFGPQDPRSPNPAAAATKANALPALFTRFMLIIIGTDLRTVKPAFTRGTIFGWLDRHGRLRVPSSGHFFSCLPLGIL